MSDAVSSTGCAHLLGPEGVERDPHGLPRAVPESDDALALVCQTAQDEGWQVPARGPRELAAARRPGRPRPQHARARRDCAGEPGRPGGHRAGRGHRSRRSGPSCRGTRLWLALDPPGRPDRTIGSVVATGDRAGRSATASVPCATTSSGCTVATGDGRLVDAGGRVVKNVAGYDLTKLQVGGFGGFGVITELHLRLRARARGGCSPCSRSGGRHA